MTKFRDNTGIILWILIGSFGLLWVVMDVFDPNALMMGPRTLGSVNGEPISYEEYNGRVQYYSNAYSQQTGQSMNSELRAAYESQVWEEIVSAKLLEQKMDELGISVTDDELLDMVYGENPDPLIRQYFQREDGTIDPFMVQNVLSDEQYSQEAVAIELQLRQKRRQEKLSNYITSGLQVTQTEIEREFVWRNTFAELEYLRFPYSDVNESTIQIPDMDLYSYYNANKELYTQEKSYRANYVRFSTLPTSEDSAIIREELENLRTDFTIAESDSVFLVMQQSSTPFNGVLVDKDELREEYKAVLSVAVGEVTKVLDLGTSAAIIKKISEDRNKIQFAVMSRIYEALPATLNEAGEKADEFQYFAEENDFIEEANRAELSVGSIFATDGNTFISGLGNSQQVLDFLSRSDVGDISAPIELSNELVVLQLIEVTEEGFRPFEDVRSQLEAAVRIEKRKEILQAQIQEWLTQHNDMISLSEATGKSIESVVNVSANSTVLKGAGREPEVIGYAFSMDVDERSGPIAGESAVYVLHLINKTKPNLAATTPDTFENIRQQLEQELNNEYLSVWILQLKDEADIIDNRFVLLQ
ncbi:MAG: SurA N-terminal domain-containing protein [Bacteroidota bacterium]|nr:SurA N-terminal domain-containing protein [Bacteroidota bacterium]